jgi:methylaspartate mutase sigma subunit
MNKAVLTTLPSDSHTWNLVYLQLLLEELGLETTNLGSCVPFEEVVGACRERRPDLLVVSSVNGHGGLEGRWLLAQLSLNFPVRAFKVVIGGKLATAPGREHAFVGELLGAGADAVFVGDTAIPKFIRFLEAERRQVWGAPLVVAA